MNKPINVSPWILLTRVFKSHNLEPYKAIAELIDNSTVAVQDKNKVANPIIRIDYVLDEKKLTISDNGVGFNYESRKDAVDYGRMKALDGRNKYNVGMKNAMYWLGDDIQIDSFDSNEKKCYTFKVTLNQDEPEKSQFENWYESDELDSGTRITIGRTRMLFSDYKRFKQKIIDQLRFVYNKDLEMSKYTFVFSFRRNEYDEGTREQIFPLKITFEYDETGKQFFKGFPPIKSSDGVMYKYEIRVMDKKTKNRTNYGGINFYYKDRLIYQYPIRNINSDKYSYMRTKIDVEISGENVNLSYSKDALLSDHSELLYEIKKSFNKHVVPFFEWLEANENEGKPEVTVEPTSNVTDNIESIKDNLNMILYDAIDEDFNFEFRVKYQEDPNSMIKADYNVIVPGEIYEILLYESFTRSQLEKLVIACLCNYKNDIDNSLDVVDIISNGEFR